MSPISGFEDKSVRNSIIKLLSANYNLSVKEIFEQLNSENKSITYPSVYKSLKLLVREKKVVKQNKKFSLNIDWIKYLKKFSDQLQDNYQTDYLPGLDKFNEENMTKTFSFNNLSEADEYRKKLQMEYIQNKTDYPYCGIYNHLKSPIIRPERSLQILSIVNKNSLDSYKAVSSDSALDRWCAKFHTRIPNIFIKTGLNIPSAKICDIMILGDIIVQIYIPEKIQKYIDNVYKKTKKIEDINVKEFYENVYIVQSKTMVVVTVNKNIAKHMRDQVLGYFKK